MVMRLLKVVYSKYNHMDNQKLNLKTQWQENPCEQILSDKASYKINRNKFLGRGGFGIVYQGIMKKSSPTGNVYNFVAIKEFKKSQKWKEDNDKDKQLVILSRFAKELDSKYILEALDIFQHKHTRRYFLITSWCSEGSLTDRIRSIKSQKQIHEFVLRMAQILNHIHYQALKYYKATDRVDETIDQVGILHRDVKPANIVYKGKQQSTLYLLDFGVAKIGYSDKCMTYNNCGTNNYKAPQINQNRPYNCKSDIYGLGCTLYEMLNGGVKLIGSAGISTKYAERQKYVIKKLEQLNFRLMFMKGENTIANPVYWMQILSKCLAHDFKNRFSSKDLLQFVKGTNFHAFKSEKQWYFGQLTPDEKAMKIKFESFLINFQIFRLSLIQDRVFGLFELMYFEEPCIQKFTLYVIMKYITIYFNDRLSRLKDQMKIQIPIKEKSGQMKVIEENKMKEIQKKATQKLRKVVQKEKESGRENNKPLQNYLQRYPELLYESTAQPRKILYEFCYQRRYQLIENQKLGRMLAIIMMMMDEWDYYAELKVEPREFQSSQVEVLSIRRQHKLLMNIEKKIRDEGLKNIFETCRVEGSPISHLNKEENKTDIKIEKNYNP